MKNWGSVGEVLTVGGFRQVVKNEGAGRRANPRYWKKKRCISVDKKSGKRLVTP